MITHTVYCLKGKVSVMKLRHSPILQYKNSVRELEKKVWGGGAGADPERRQRVLTLLANRDVNDDVCLSTNAIYEQLELTVTRSSCQCRLTACLLKPP
jgi:hypothetical protein